MIASAAASASATAYAPPSASPSTDSGSLEGALSSGECDGGCAPFESAQVILSTLPPEEEPLHPYEFDVSDSDIFHQFLRAPLSHDPFGPWLKEFDLRATCLREYEAMMRAGMRDSVLGDPFISVVIEEVTRQVNNPIGAKCAWCQQGFHPLDWHDRDMHWTCRIWREVRHTQFCGQAHACAECSSCRNPPANERERAVRHFAATRALCFTERKEAMDQWHNPERVDELRRRSLERIVAMVVAFREEMRVLILSL